MGKARGLRTRSAGMLAGALLLLASAASAAEQDAVEAPAPSTPEEGGESAAAPAEPEAAAKARRDPFRPFNLDFQEAKDAEPKTPLEQYDLGSLTLVAVIWNVSDPKAMVEDDAGLGYTIGVGTPIGRSGGVVKKIEPDRVIVEEEFTDFYGEKNKTEKVLKLKPEGEKKP
ncbi:MAG: pilus assembly protein PilP [Candidatus Binatia bacterium]